MTIKELVLAQDIMGVNDWIKLGKEKKLTPLEMETLIQCADYYKKIKINHSASFTQAINL